MTAEAYELAAMRKREHARRAILVSRFIAMVENLLADASKLSSAPASVSAAVVRALIESRREFGATPLPANEISSLTGTPGVIITIEGGDDHDDPIIPLPT